MLAGIRSRWSWARLERRAQAGHRRDVAATVAELARTHAAITRVETSDEGIGLVLLVLGGWSVVLAGLTPLGLSGAESLVDYPGELLLTGAGRYDRAPFVVVTARTFDRTLLASHVRAVRRPGGGRDVDATVAPLGPTASRR
jgi:hypothetical protein